MKYFLTISLFILFICLNACQSKMICPAFQSTFIYNDSTRESLFAYFGEDSLPSLSRYSSKNKYGIVEKETKRKRRDQMRIVKMERVFPDKTLKPDTTLLAMGDANLEEGSGNIDSLVNASPKIEMHYNVEQENYIRLFGNLLYKPAPPEDEETDATATEATETTDSVEDNLSRKERRQAKKEAKQKRKEEAQQEDTSVPVENQQEEDQNQGDF